MTNPYTLENSSPKTSGDIRTVLIVEDEGPLRLIARRQLSDLGYQVLEAEDADGAVKLMEAGAKIDLLFTDIVMPGRTNGMELARLALKRWPALKIILTSGTASGSDPSLGGLRLLGKPYLKKDLDRVLREAFEGAA